VIKGLATDERIPLMEHEIKQNVNKKNLATRITKRRMKGKSDG